MHYTSEHKAQQLVRTFGSVLRGFPYRNMLSFYLHGRASGEWFRKVLRSSDELSSEEVELRVKGCESGGVATAVLLFGSKRRLILFPNKFELVCQLCEGVASRGEGMATRVEGVTRGRGVASKREEGVASIGEEGVASREEEGVASRGEEGVASREEEGVASREEEGVASRVEEGVASREEEGVATRGEGVASRRVPEHQDRFGKREGLRHREVGQVLGNTLGYESSEDESSTGSEQEGAELVGSRSHDYAASNPAHRSSYEDEELAWQVREYFQHWCERLADGSLKRYRVEEWPEWTHP